MQKCFSMFAIGLAISSSSALAGIAPHVDIASVDELKQPLPLPYDVAANADMQVAAAKSRAKTNHKLLLIDLGGNWCGDCRVMAGIMDIPSVKAFVKANYEVVTVDIGRMDKNQQIPARYGIKKLQGVPALLIIDPVSNRLVNAGRVSALADARHMSPQALANWLAQWTIR